MIREHVPKVGEKMAEPSSVSSESPWGGKVSDTSRKSKGQNQLSEQTVFLGEILVVCWDPVL